MLRYSRHARRRMIGRNISETEAEEAWVARHVTIREMAVDRRSADVLVIRSTLESSRRLKRVVSADDERFVITAAVQDEEDR